MIQEVSIPARMRARKHVFTEEDANNAVAVLEAGGNPGKGGYDTQGKARTAAITLAEMCGDTIGTSTWFNEEDGTWWFALKVGKKAPPKKKSAAKK